MIRFIDIGKQIAVDEYDPEWPREFAWFDTISDVFLCFDGAMVWESWNDFENSWRLHYHGKGDPSELKRFRSLTHEWAFV